MRFNKSYPLSAWEFCCSMWPPWTGYLSSEGFDDPNIPLVSEISGFFFKITE